MAAFFLLSKNVSSKFTICCTSCSCLGSGGIITGNSSSCRMTYQCTTGAEWGETGSGQGLNLPVDHFLDPRAWSSQSRRPKKSRALTPPEPLWCGGCRYPLTSRPACPHPWHPGGEAATCSVIQTYKRNKPKYHRANIFHNWRMLHVSY